MNRSGWWSSLGTGAKMAAIPLAFIVAIGVLAFVTTGALKDQQPAARVSLANRVRILNQKHLREVLMTSLGHSRDYRATREQLTECLRTLREGGTAEVARDLTETVDPMEDPRLLEEIGRHAETMFAEADALLALPAGDPRQSAQVERLEESSLAVTEDAEQVIANTVREANAALRNVIQLEWFLAGLVLVVGSGLAWVVSRAILNPLSDCVTVAREIADGNLAVAPIQVVSTDEVGRLGETFNYMRESLRGLLSGISGAVETLGASCSQILAAAQEQASGAAQQAASIQETTSTMEEVGQTGNQIAERARLVAADAEATSAASVIGIEGVQQATRTMENIRRQVEAVAENVVMLSEKTQAVGEVIAAVKDIAERSNLLALNAAIEAAAAGEEGRSFSVVAAEMKSLAEQSREATVTVRRILEEIQRGINTSVMLTEEAVKRVEAGKEQTEKAESTIRDLNRKVEDSVQAFQQITAATNQQQIGYEQVSQALRNIEQATEQTVAATRQLEASVVAINDLADRLRSHTGAYKL